ncbi:MAG: hypothetical protein M3Y43_02900, partial [Pseudomonadota bacterium]|nr:hypothetical protein [Pseudomonadota bacterium]
MVAHFITAAGDLFFESVAVAHAQTYGGARLLRSPRWLGSHFGLGIPPVGRCGPGTRAACVSLAVAAAVTVPIAIAAAVTIASAVAVAGTVTVAPAIAPPPA